jgi:hypothetical protein
VCCYNTNYNVHYFLTGNDGDTKQRLYWSKEAKDFRFRNVYAAKSYAFRNQIEEDVIEMAKKPTQLLSGVSQFDDWTLVTDLVDLVRAVVYSGELCPLYLMYSICLVYIVFF